MRPVAAGVVTGLNKDEFTRVQLCTMIGIILQDKQGHFRHNLRRMQRKTHVDSRRKDTAADAVEELLYAWGLGYEVDPNEQPLTEHLSMLVVAKNFRLCICRRRTPSCLGLKPTT